MNTRVGRVAAVATVLLVALGLTACAPGGDAGDDTPSAGPGVSESATPTDEPGDGGVDPASLCTRDDLDISYEATDNTAGQMHGLLRMVNTSSDACTLDGYPILFMGNSEVAEPVGQQADYDEVDTAVAFQLEPGDAGEAAVTITQAGNVGCEIAQTTHMVAAPPLDHVFVWEDDGRNVPIGPTDSCNDPAIGLLRVGALHPA